MKNLQAVLGDMPEAQPTSMNRRLQNVLAASTLDLDQISMLVGVPSLRLSDYFSGRVLLCAPELSALAVTLRDVLRENNRRLEGLLSRRPVRKVRKPRSPEVAAAACATARAVRRAKAAAKRAAKKSPSLAGPTCAAGDTPPVAQCEAGACG